MRRSILVLLLLVTGLLFVRGSIFAQASSQEFNVTLSPTLLDLTANPGDTLKEKFRIRNNSNAALPLSIIVNKLDPHVRNGEVVPVAPEPNDPSIDWISFENATVTAQPNEWTDISFTIAVPKTAAYGYYYALRIGPANSNNQTNGAATKLLGQVVLPVLLIVNAPNAKSVLKLESFGPSTFFNEYLPVTFTVKLSNTGNIQVRPSGTIFVDLGKNTTSSIDLNPGGGVVLPGQMRIFQRDWLDGFLVQQPVMEDGNPKIDKNGKEITQLVFNWNNLTHFRIGKYTATVLLVYDDGTRDVPLEATTTFFVFPYVAVSIILVGTITVVLFFSFVLRRYIAHEVRKQQQH